MGFLKTHCCKEIIKILLVYFCHALPIHDFNQTADLFCFKISSIFFNKAP